MAAVMEGDTWCSPLASMWFCTHIPKEKGRRREM